MKREPAGILRWLFVLLAFAQFWTAHLLVADEPVGAGDQDAVGQIQIPFENSQALLPVPSTKEETSWDEAAPEWNFHHDPLADRVEFDSEAPESEESLHKLAYEEFLEALGAPAKPLAGFIDFLSGADHLKTATELSGDAIGLQPLPDRPRLLLEGGEKFFAPGFLEQGIVLPTGAVWRPTAWVFGTMRSGLAYHDNHAGTRFTEWANRLDLFGQLNLSGTERLLVGLRPLDRERGRRRSFSSYQFHDGDWIDAANSDIQTLFFEGDFGEIFPNLDPYDTKGLDYGFSVGRQPMLFQQGLLINEDMIDATTVTKNTLNGHGILNMRATGVYAWNRINRNNNVPDPDAQLVGLFTESDLPSGTVNADIAYVHSQTDLGGLIAFGLSNIRRDHGTLNTYNTSTHVLASFPTQEETQASGRGVLLFHQLSWTLHHTEDIVYLNTFWAIDQFTSPARGTLAGGPLGQVGILFASAGLGQFGAPLSNQASDAAGGSIGYQLFHDEFKQQVIFEVGGRESTNGTDDGAIGIGARFQRALNQHWIAVIDGFAVKREGRDVAPGVRLEFLAKF